MANEPPPSYASIFKQLAAKKAETDGIVGYGKGAAEVFGEKSKSTAGIVCCGVVCSLLGLALPITEIVIGSLYLKECPAERLLPIYLIVFGVFGVVSGSSGSGQRIANRKKSTDVEEGEQDKSPKRNIGSCCSSLVNGFLFAWLICGSIWVFQMQECATTDNLFLNSTNVDCFTKDVGFASSTFYCRALLYDFVFYATIVKWALVGVGLLACMMVCCCMCCVFCCVKSAANKQAGEDREMTGKPNNSYS